VNYDKNKSSARLFSRSLVTVEYTTQQTYEKTFFWNNIVEALFKRRIRSVKRTLCHREKPRPIHQSNEIVLLKTRPGKYNLVFCPRLSPIYHKMSK
jgi:hypothetical protein